MKRKRYSVEFKKEAVRLLIMDGMTAPEASKKLGVSANMLYRWKQIYLDELGEYFQWASSWHLQMGWPTTTKQTKDTRWVEEYAHRDCLTQWLEVKHGNDDDNEYDNEEKP